MFSMLTWVFGETKILLNCGMNDQKMNAYRRTYILLKTDDCHHMNEYM